MSSKPNCLRRESKSCRILLGPFGPPENLGDTTLTLLTLLFEACGLRLEDYPQYDAAAFSSRQALHDPGTEGMTATV